VFPIEKPLTHEAYELLFDNVARKILHTGFRHYEKKAKGAKTLKTNSSAIRWSGLDLSKRPATSLFYLPCQAADPCESFLMDYNGDGRKLLDPLPWLENGIAPVVPEIIEAPQPVASKHQVNQARVEAAINEWRQSGVFPGEGDTRLWRFAVELRGAGMGLSDIEATLQSEYQYARNPKERRDQIQSIIKSLKKSKLRIA